METFTPKEFLEKLEANDLKPTFALKGIVKKSGNNSEILFTRKGDFENWIAIPSAMIETVKIIKTFQKEGQTFVVVFIQFKTLITPEGIFMQKIMASDEHFEGEHCGCCMQHHHHMGCEYRHKSYGQPEGSCSIDEHHKMGHCGM